METHCAAGAEPELPIMAVAGAAASRAAASQCGRGKATDWNQSGTCWPGWGSPIALSDAPHWLSISMRSWSLPGSWLDELRCPSTRWSEALRDSRWAA